LGYYYYYNFFKTDTIDNDEWVLIVLITFLLFIGKKYINNLSLLIPNYEQNFGSICFENL